MIKLTNILKEIKIRSVNRPDLHTNEGLLDFLNQNLQEFIKHEGIWHEHPDSVKLRLRNHDGKTEITWNLFGIDLTYHWLCPEKELPGPGSGEWERTEFKGVEFWKLVE